MSGQLCATALVQSISKVLLLYPGTNWYALLQIERASKEEVTEILAAHAANCVKVIRFWGFINGYNGTEEASARYPIQAGHAPLCDCLACLSTQAS
jgi:hypothetical protein